ncbi:hypothetical protein [Streptomyces sp. 147326]|uniref:hypothetical protein n=1 Tax=Streptomyces sp. 147326 TaxID=3074379 RepID=UPI0038575A53
MHSITKKIAAGIGTAAAALGCVIATGPSAVADGKWVEDVAKFRTHRDHAYPQRRFPAGTRLCTEGFRGGAGVGLPCVTLTG